MKNIIAKFLSLSKRDKIVLISILWWIVLIWVIFTWKNIINKIDTIPFDNTESLSKLDQFKKTNAEQSKTVSIKEISDEKKSRLWISIESTLSLIDTSAKKYNDSIMAQMKIASADKNFNLATFQKEVKAQNEKFKSNKEKLVSMKSLLSGTGTLIINKDLELAILKQINELWSNYSIWSISSTDAPPPVLPLVNLSWSINNWGTWSLKDIKNNSNLWIKK